MKCSAARSVRRYSILICALVLILQFGMWSHAFAATLSGGNYTLNGGPTAISNAQSSGGSYSEQSTADPASGNSSGGTYTTTAAPAAPTATTPSAPSAPSNPSVPTYAGSSGGVSGQIIMTEIPVSQTSPGTNGASENGQDAGGTRILISNVRIIRSAPTSVTITFTTNVPAIGNVAYAISSGEIVTLTDSATSTDHSFIVTQLDPSLEYHVNLRASSESAFSDVYQFALAPEWISSVGERITPILEAATSSSPVIDSVTAATTSPKKSSSFLHWLPTVFIVILLLILVILWRRIWARKHKT